MEINLNAFSKRSMQIFQSALRFVTHMGHGFIGSEHFLWALAQDQGSAGRALRKNGLDKNLIEEYLHQYDLDAKAGGNYRAIQISEEAEQVIHLAERRAESRGREKLEPEDLLRGILDGTISKNTVASIKNDFSSLESSITAIPIINDSFAEERCEICGHL